MKSDLPQQIRDLGSLLLVFGWLIIVLSFGLLYLKNNPAVFEESVVQEEASTTEAKWVELDSETIAQSGFIDDEGVSQVIQNCTQCHSAKLVTQNQMSASGWDATISWMQETQNLWDLGQNRERIVAYLAKNYGVQSKGRRQNLSGVEWYVLE